VSCSREHVCLCDMNDAELLVITTIIERMRAGREKYGRLKLDEKDWVSEAFEEALDQTNYLAMQLVKR
jgi:hypothetical protein